MILIKKYENRRLYDTSASRYVNLEDVAEMVRDGEEIKVVDSKSGEDLTHIILTQIIVESAKEKDSPLPTDLLRQLIMASGKAQQELLRKYFRFAANLYEKSQDDFRDRMSTAGVKPLNPLEAIQKFFTGQFEGASFTWPVPQEDDYAPDDEPEEDLPPDEFEEPKHEDTADAETDDMASVLSDLRQRIDELEEKLSKKKR